MATGNDDSLCLICHEFLGDNRAKLYKKGLESLIAASTVRGDECLTRELEGIEPGAKFVHPECRKRYTDKRKLGEPRNRRLYPRQTKR